MKILIAGGTIYVGRLLAEAAYARGWEVTLFHRGLSGPGLYPWADHRIGDRFTDLHLLDGDTWDFAVDTSAYFPRAVRLLGQAVQDRVGRIALLSSINVYQGDTGIHSPLKTLEDPEIEAVNAETYAGLKVFCEQELTRIWGDRGWIIRPGIICGPLDPTDRFTFWVDRVARFERFQGPHRLDQPVQAVDGRALAEYILDGLVAGYEVPTNCTGPRSRETFSTFLETTSRALGVDYPDLIESPAPRFPLELLADGSGDIRFSVELEPQLKLGLTLPSFEETIRDTWAWWNQQGREIKTGRSDAEELAAGGILRV